MSRRAFLTVLLLLACAPGIVAQNERVLGSWELNPAKSDVFIRPRHQRHRTEMPGGVKAVGVVESAQGGVTVAPQINVVLNWTEELSARVTTK